MNDNVAMIYFLAFIKCSYSYCIEFWFSNEKSERCVLVNKIDYLIENLISNYSITRSNSLSSLMLCKPLNVYKTKCLSLMYDLIKGNVSYPIMHICTNDIIRTHNTRSCVNLHIDCKTPYDKRNFIYNSALLWNNCLTSYRTLSKSLFLKRCKELLII